MIPGTKIYSGLNFEKQKPRGEFIDPRKGPSDARFDMVNHSPEVLSNVRHIPAIVMSKNPVRNIDLTGGK